MAVATLERTNYAGPVTIVDDASSCKQHMRYLDQLERSRGYRVIRRPVNGGISRAKNTCLRALAELDVDIGFLAEDDIVFYDGWDEAYVRATLSWESSTSVGMPRSRRIQWSPATVTWSRLRAVSWDC
jgi:hypothetical protein